MNTWIRKLHIYAGLLNFSILVVFGLAGLVVTFHAPDIFSSGSPPPSETRAITIPPSASDKDVGELVARELHPAHAGPPYTHRDPATHRLVIDFYSVNGLVRATVLDQSNQLRVETYRNSIWRFLDNVHATTIAEQSSDSAVHAWAWYIELSIWSLIFMAVSGAWLGLTERQRFRWTNISFAAGCAVFAAIWVLTK
ncbi:MAG: PepSY domain-containing protein [Acidobacteriota bacterium]|nr:PepSY domain-containing protein [Acidobacteriota bacterium]